LQYVKRGDKIATRGKNIMTIHHDKLAYGKLEPDMEEMTEEEIAEMLSALNEEDKEDEDEQK